jgi:hypothetical protein
MGLLEQYSMLAAPRCNPSQVLLLAELQRRMRQIERLTKTIVRLADESSVQHLNSFFAAVRQSPDTAAQFDYACDLTDQLWMLAETFYWNTARCVAVLCSVGLDKKTSENAVLPGLRKITKSPHIAVEKVRHKLIEHPEIVGGSFSVGAGTSGPMIGGGTVPDSGLYLNALEFIQFATQRLTEAVTQLQPKT